MTKLKIKSVYKYIILIIVTFLYTFFITNNLIYKTSYKEGNIKLTGYITSINYKNNNTNIILKANEKVKLVYYGILDLNIGDYVEVNGLLEKPPNNTIFNLFNYKKYLLSQKIYFTLNIDEIKKIKDNDKIIYEFKNYILKRIDSLDTKEYIKTFILGDKSGLDFMEVYQENGVSHLLAISGMHISLIAGLLSKIIKNKYKNIIISLFLIFYLFLIDFPPSGIRAVLFFILSFKFDKKKLIILLFCLMLLYNPYYIYNLGFLFSFIISFYLIYFNHLFKGNYIVKTFKISMVSFLVSIPILINNFNSINILSPLTNIIFVPLVSFIIFPLSLITLIFPFFDNILFILINLMEYISLFINYFNINITLSSINNFVIILYYLLITLSLINNKYLLLIIIILIHNNIKLFSQNSYITMLDVRQGDSILLEIKSKSILIDTGGYYNSNLVLNKTIPYLKSRGIKKLDYLILTHGDYDHMGESINLVNNFNVDNVIFNSGEYNDLELELIKLLEDKNIKYYQNIKELNIGNNKLYFLNNKLYDNENNNSNVIYTEFNGTKLLLMGDAGVDVEDNILEKYNLTDIDILKVGHHGSKTGSGEEFIDSINPKYSVISVGENNRYGHPNNEVLDNLEDSTIYRTDKNGSIMFKIKNNNLKIETCAP